MSRSGRPIHDGEEPVFGVLGYRNDSFDRASGNLGDSIQTLAALNCYRRLIHPGMPFREFLERVLTDTVPGARFVIVERDGSWRQSFPRRVVTLMNGWFMSAGADDTLEWPPHEAIDPIFVSFHVADDRLMSPAGVAYLQRFAPIGCRDQATVEKLVAHGIEAYLSGCLTLTIDFLRWLGGRPRRSVCGCGAGRGAPPSSTGQRHSKTGNPDFVCAPPIGG